MQNSHRIRGGAVRSTSMSTTAPMSLAAMSAAVEGLEVDAAATRQTLIRVRGGTSASFADVTDSCSSPACVAARLVDAASTGDVEALSRAIAAQPSISRERALTAAALGGHRRAVLLLLASTVLARHGKLSCLQVALHHPRLSCRVRVAMVRLLLQRRRPRGEAPPLSGAAAAAEARRQERVRQVMLASACTPAGPSLLATLASEGHLPRGAGGGSLADALALSRRALFALRGAGGKDVRGCYDEYASHRDANYVLCGEADPTPTRQHPGPPPRHHHHRPALTTEMTRDDPRSPQAPSRFASGSGWPACAPLSRRLSSSLSARLGVAAAPVRPPGRGEKLEPLCCWLSRLAAAPWTPSSHAAYPPRFRAAVRTLLLCAAREGASPAVLPTEVRTQPHARSHRGAARLATAALSAPICSTLALRLRRCSSSSSSWPGDGSGTSICCSNVPTHTSLAST